MFGIFCLCFMNKFNKIFCSFFAVVMCFTMLSSVAFADAPYEGNHQGTITVSVHDIVADSPLKNATIQLEDITAGREFNYGTKRQGLTVRYHGITCQVGGIVLPRRLFLMATFSTVKRLFVILIPSSKSKCQ